MELFSPENTLKAVRKGVIALHQFYVSTKYRFDDLASTAFLQHTPFAWSAPTSHYQVPL